MELNLQFILDSLSREASWKQWDYTSFSFENWDLTLKRESDQYYPFTFSVSGQKRNTNETISRRYVGLEQAYLHILNRFNENMAIENRFKSLSDIMEHFPQQSSVQKMEASYFRMPEEALSIARMMLDHECPEPYYILRPQFMNAVPSDKQCFLGIDHEAKERQLPAAEVLNEKDYLTVFDPGDNVIAVISMEDVLHKEDFAAIMERCGMEPTESNFNKIWSVFPNNIPSGASLKDLALAAIQAVVAKESLEFLFADEITASDDLSALEGYVWAMASLVNRLKAQEPPLTEEQSMENINFYPVYNLNTGRVSLEGHYYLEDTHETVGKGFSLPLTPDESNRLREAFEEYCLKTEGKSCLSFLRDLEREYKQEHKPLTDQIRQAEARAAGPFSDGSPTKDDPSHTR